MLFGTIIRVSLGAAISVLIGGCTLRSNRQYNWKIPANGTREFSVCGSGYDVIVTCKGGGKLEVIATNKDEGVRATIAAAHPVPVYSTKQPGKASFVLKAIEQAAIVEVEVINDKGVEIVEKVLDKDASLPK